MLFWTRREKKREPDRMEEAREVEVHRKRRSIVPMEAKLLAVEARESGMSAREIGEMLGTAATTVEGWMRAYREGGAEGLARKHRGVGSKRICRELEERITRHRETYPDRGVRRIRDDLKREEGLAVSAETVRRVVKEAGLENPAPHAARGRPAVQRFEREIPNAMWQIDIFTFELKRMYRVYLVGVIDDHSRYIVGHGLFRQQTAEAVLEVVKGAISQWGAPREILSDNGRQFVAWHGKTRFQKVLTREGVEHVRSAPHHPMTLGKIERFWKTIWEEFLEEAQFASFADARQRIDHWVGYYNHQRPHQGIDGACPADRFYGIANDVSEAVKQGCQENALAMALGQETRPPFFLLGRLGTTDVRLERRGDEVVLQLGDKQESIKLGTPYEADGSGGYRRGEEGKSHDDTMEGHDRSGAVACGGDGEEQGDGVDGDLSGVRGEPAGIDAGHGQGDGGEPGCFGAEEAWPQGEERGSAEDYRALEAAILAGEGGESLEGEV